jgi:hypothetical protein
MPKCKCQQNSGCVCTWHYLRDSGQLYTRWFTPGEQPPLPTVQEAGWGPELVWKLSRWETYLPAPRNWTSINCLAHSPAAILTELILGVWFQFPDSHFPREKLKTVSSIVHVLQTTMTNSKLKLNLFVYLYGKKKLYTAN